MANADSISPETTEHIRMLLDSIAGMSVTMRDLSVQALTSGDERGAAAMIDALGSVASQIGYTANMAIKMISDTPVEDAAYWFLPPSCRGVGRAAA